MSSEHPCTPVVVPEICDDPPTDCEISDCDYLQAVAILKAAEWCVVGCADLGCFDRQDIQYGTPIAYPTCCNHLSVGIRPDLYEVEVDGNCFTQVKPQFELMVSRCQPQMDGENLPPGGDLSGCNPGSLSEHALYMHRHTQALSKHLLKMICCFSDKEQCPDCKCGQLRILEYDYENDGTCAQIRMVIGYE